MIIGGGGGKGNSAEYKQSYDIEMENAMEFESAHFLDKSMTRDSVGYEMYAYENAMGKSLVTRTREDMEELERAHRSANRDGASYGMSQQAIDGMKAALKEKINLRKQAIDIMVSARSEYEKFKKQAWAANEKQRRSGKRK